MDEVVWMGQPGGQRRGKAKPAIQEILTRAVELHRSGSLERAERLYRRILKTHPGHADALHLSGLIAHQQGRHPRAVQLIRKAIRSDDAQAVFHANLANAHIELEQWEEAERAGRAALALDGGRADAHTALGRALEGQRSLAGAASAYEASLTLDPGNNAVRMRLSSVLHALGVAQSARGELSAAAGSFEAACRTGEGAGEPYLQARLNLASVYSALGRFDEAVSLFREVIDESPRSAQAHHKLGLCYSEKGDMEQSLACFRKAVEIDPRHVEAWYALGTSGTDLLPEELESLSRLSASGELGAEDGVKIEFALAAQAERQGAAERAFASYRRANDLRRECLAAQGEVFDPQEHRLVAALVEGLFTREFFATRSGWGVESDLPVFVVGMPRSGTTLTERIAAAHRLVAGVGERDDVPRFVEGLGPSFPDAVDRLSPEESTSFAAEHLARLRDLGGDARRVIDKMPANFMYLGLIAILFPGARIIHCRRDPRDTGLSCYFQNFSRGIAWSCDLSHIGVYHRTYERVMEHWRRVLPIPMLEVRYEEMVADQERLSREIIEFLELEWDSQCLEFHRAGGAVRTASKWQVRQPIYSRAVGRWKAYEDQLAPLIRELERGPGP